VKEVQLRLSGRVDREQTDGYNVTLVALDAGRPALSTQLPVNVIIVDANDSPPSFDHVEYLVQVREDVTPGTGPTLQFLEMRRKV